MIFPAHVYNGTPSPSMLHFFKQISLATNQRIFETSEAWLVPLRRTLHVLWESLPLNDHSSGESLVERLQSNSKKDATQDIKYKLSPYSIIGYYIFSYCMCFAICVDVDVLHNSDSEDHKEEGNAGSISAESMQLIFI